MIHQVKDSYVISSRGSWLPGIYAIKEAARYAFQLPDATLAELRERVNVGEERDITTGDLKAARAERTA